MGFRKMTLNRFGMSLWTRDVELTQQRNEWQLGGVAGMIFSVSDQNPTVNRTEGHDLWWKRLITNGWMIWGWLMQPERGITTTGLRLLVRQRSGAVDT
jgi:hypothetical protein